MSMLQKSEKVVLSGTYLWAGEYECDIRIVLSPIQYGTGDYEDPPEIGEDQDRPTFYVQYGSTTERGYFNAGGGGYPTLAEAMAVAQAAPGIGHTVKWLPSD